MSSWPHAAFGIAPRAGAVLRARHPPVKHCPTCAAVFPDSTTFCEEDGEVLVEVAAPSRRATALAQTIPVSPPPKDTPLVASGLRISDITPSPTSAQLRGIVDEALTIASAFDVDGLMWQPQAEDFVRAENGRLALTQARGVCKRIGAFDARWVLRAVGEALAPVPLAYADTELVRVLFRPRAARLSIEQARIEVMQAPPEMSGAVALDVGFARERQEDTAYASDQGPLRVAVLCDGVSLSADGGLASRVGAKTAFSFAEQRAAIDDDDEETAREAIRVAHAAVCARVEELEDVMSGGEHDNDPPGSTIVVAIVRGERATVGWLGDSRAYLVGAGDVATLLTRDHSWKNEVERLGYEADPNAMGPLSGALTRCIGPLEAGARGEVNPDVVTCAMLEGQTLIVCSDGLWSYFPDAPLLGKVVAFHQGATETELAVRLVNHALIAGGDDNVSVTVFQR